MKIALWVVQIILGIYFFFIGVLHFIIPEGLPAQMAWMYELPPALHWVSGIAEILGGLGLILPAVTRIQTRLVPLAAAGLFLTMIGALGWHATRGEFQNIGFNVMLAVLAAFVAYGRWRLHPLTDRNEGATA